MVMARVRIRATLYLESHFLCESIKKKGRRKCWQTKMDVCSWHFLKETRFFPEANAQNGETHRYIDTVTCGHSDTKT